MATNVLRFEFLAADHFTPTAERVSHKLDTMGERLGVIGKAAAFALGTVAVGGIAAFGFEMVKGIASATEYQTLQLKTAAVIKSTGNIAHLSVAGVDELAHKLQETSGVEEALIINSENVLATFTNIRNQTGKNNDIYNQATARILDLSVAMGEDLQSATVQVGKALNDPIKGMTALQRVGVSFTASQKEQVKHLVLTGHLMAAQKIILHELGKEFGGAAKAAGAGLGGALDRLRNVLDDTFRDMAIALLPTLTKVANWLAERLPGAIAVTSKAFSTLGGWLMFIGKNVGLPVYRFLVSTLQALGARLLVIGKTYGPPVLAFFKLVGGYIASLVKTYGPPVIGFFKMIAEKLAKVGNGKLLMAALAGAIGGLLIPVVGALVLAFVGLATAVWAALAPMLPFIAVGAAVGAVAYLLITNWQRITAIFAFLGPIVSTVVHYFRDMLLPALRDAAAKVFPAIRGAIDSVAAAFKDHQDVVRVFGKIFMFILKAIGVALAVLGVLIVKVVIPVIAELLVVILSAVAPIVRALLTITGTLFSVIAGIASFVVSVAQTVARIAVAIVNAFTGAGKWLYNAGRSIVTGLVNGVTTVWPHILVAIGHTIDLILGPWKPALLWLFHAGVAVLRGLINGVTSLFGTVASTIRNFITRYVWAPFVGASGWLVQRGRDIVSGFWHGVVSVGDWLRRSITGIITGKIWPPFATAGKWLINAGSNLIGGLWTGITNALSNVKGWINDHVVKPIIGAVKWFFGISSPSRVMMGIGGHLMSGLIQGLIKHNPVKMIGKIFGGMPSALGAIVSKGLVSIASLPGRALAALGTLGADVQAALGMSGGLAVQGGGNSANRQMGQKMAAYYGWTGNQWAALNNLWMGESGWNNLARNPSSGAFGIPQALPPGKMGPAAAGGNAAAQIAWGLSYIRSVYGSPANAYAKWLGRSPHWYDEGGILRGKGFFGKNTGADERVLSPRQTKWFERAMALGARSGGGHAHSGVTVVLNAPNYVGSRDDLLDEFNRFARQGRLDAIVRMASR